MKVLVTGGAGYIGSACVQEWVEQGHQVTVVDNLSKGHRGGRPSRRTIHQGLSQPSGTNRKHSPPGKTGDRNPFRGIGAG